MWIVALYGVNVLLLEKKMALDSHVFVFKGGVSQKYRLSQKLTKGWINFVFLGL